MFLLRKLLHEKIYFQVPNLHIVKLGNHTYISIGIIRLIFVCLFGTFPLVVNLFESFTDYLSLNLF